MPIKLDNPAAFAPLHTDVAAVSGKRYENSVTRSLSLSCRCCVLIGDYMDTGDRSPGAKSALDVTIELCKTEWPDHTPPQKGDVFTVADHGTMIVRGRPMDIGGAYRIRLTLKQD